MKRTSDHVALPNHTSQTLRRHGRKNLFRPLTQVNVEGNNSMEASNLAPWKIKLEAFKPERQPRKPTGLFKPCVEKATILRIPIVQNAPPCSCMCNAATGIHGHSQPECHSRPTACPTILDMDSKTMVFFKAAPMIG